jgi:DNA-binding GntR family transcriptional regulator
MAEDGSTGLKGAAGKQIVVEGLRQLIRAGEMAPGQRLVEAEVVGMFGVTRGSVRAAIQDLAAEGMIELIPNRGARVRVVSLEEAISILECRRVLEGLIAAHAAERVSKDDAKKLKDIGRQMQRAVKEGDLLTYAQLDARLHPFIAEISQQQTASEIIVRLKSQIVRHQFRLSLRPGRPQISLESHLELIDSVVSRDPVRAEASARDHVASVIEALQSGADQRSQTA